MSSRRIFSNAVIHGDADVERNEEQNEDLLRGPKSDEFTMYLNKGEEDEMQLVCYKNCKFKAVITYLFFILTVGILRLIFHWIPHLRLYATSKKCKIEDAEKVLIIEIYNGKHKIYHVRPVDTLTPASVAKLQRDNSLLNHQLPVSGVPPALSVHFENGEFRELDKLQLFSCKKITYIWDIEKREFAKLAGLETGVSCDVFHKYKALTTSEQFMRLLVYGHNVIEVKEQTILALFCLEVLNPFYIFQIMSFILWILDDYYYYGATIILMSLFGIGMTVMQTRKNQRNLKSTIHSSDVCTVLRHLPKNPLDEVDVPYKTETISTELLVPGDIMEIPSYGCTMHCDAVLLTGNCIVNESMLTGESVPVTKTSLPNIQNSSYDPKEHARHTLFCGTRIIQTRYFGNEKVLAIVVRTGFSTAKGSLVRSILYPPPVDFRFEKDSYRFVAILFSIAICGFVYTVVTKALKGISAGELTLEALDLITVTVPPALPAAMTVGRFYAQSRLKKNQIYCISPRSINVSGSVDCVCFDKTGTLTEDGLDMQCVVPVENKSFKLPVTNVETLPYDVLLFGLVSCHSLTIIDKQIVGDPLDLKMFESTKWVMEEHEVADNSKYDMMFPTVFKPPKNRPNEHQNITDDLEIGIIKEFPFSSNSQRMGVIIRRLGGTHFEYYCKGSPEMLLNFIKPESVPNDFSDILESYTQEGYRVIALAHKKLKLSFAKVQKVHRDVIEKDLDFLGFIILENRLKPDTTPCIQALNDANIRIIMVTGDNILTALSVAKDCDIVTPGQTIISINCDDNEPPNLYFTLTSTKHTLPSDLSILTNSASAMSLETVESQVQTVTNSLAQTGSKRPSVMLNNYRFAMTGKVWDVIKEYYSDLLPRICVRGSIFARMAPEQKQQLVQELQGVGYCVAMCGDGANDCGALRAAHTGISLSDAESSVASPFTSKNPNINCVLQVIKEGRAALVTSFGIFKYMASYSMCQFVTVLLLYSIESNLTDMEFLYIDLAMISVFAFFFGRTESYRGKLVKETPLSSLVSLSPVLSLLLQIILVLIFQVAAFEHLKSEPWYTPLDTTKEEVACVENYTLYTISSFQYIILAIVFSKGYPYRRSIFSNWGFITSIIIMTSISIYLALFPSDFLIKSFELVLPKDFNFQLFLLGYAFANFVLSLLVEYLIVEKIFFQRLRFKFHNVDKSKRKYLAVERDLNQDRKWPVLTSDFQSAASPSSPEQVYSAEIIIEKENKFNKDHILNKLYESSEGPCGDTIQSLDLKNSFKENFDNTFPSSQNDAAVFQVNGVVGNACETGYFSQEDLLFSSLPSETQTSPSDTFQSLSNNTNTNYDLANSNVNIPELPFDENACSPLHTSYVSEKIDVPITIRNISEKSPQRNIELLKSMKIHDSPVGTPNNDGSNFNSFGRSPPQTQVKPKPLELNNFEMNS